MGVTLTSYPVQVVGGKVQNVFAGFKPIELYFANDDSSIIGVEASIVAPTSPYTDLLGFNLFSDFSPTGVAVVDVSIINDLNSQDVILSTQEIEDSRIQFKVKYRPVYEDGTEDAFILIDETPIIACFSISDFELDKWITPVEEPIFWKGYQLMSGLIHSTQNEIGLGINIKYDVLDIQKNILTSDSILDGFTSAKYGIFAVNLNIPDSGVQEIYPVVNGGGDGATDFINAVGGLAESWFVNTYGGSANTPSIVTGNGFTGNAQRLQSDSSASTSINGIAVAGLNPAKTWKMRIKYRCSAGVQYWLRGVIVTAPLPINTADAVVIEKSITPINGAAVIGFDVAGTGAYIEFDEVEIISEASGGLTSDAAYIDYKIISE